METRREVMPSGKVWIATKQPNGSWLIDVEMTETEWREYTDYKRSKLRLPK